MFKITSTGNFKKTRKYLDSIYKQTYIRILDRYGQMGVELLKENTPIDTGLTADSWGYAIEINRDSYTISWTNSNTADNIPIVILLQYGHATRNGGFVEGIDFVNPAIEPVFKQMAHELWKKVTPTI